MEPVLRWGEDNKTIPPFKRILMAGKVTLHATYEEAEERTIQMWKFIRIKYKETMAIPFVAGRKAEHEKFAGAEDTYTIEALMHDGKHFSLRQAISSKRFPDAFESNM